MLLSTYGGRGDVEPLVGLAVRLRELGVEVRVCAPPDWAERLTRFGVPLVPIGPPVRTESGMSDSDVRVGGCCGCVGSHIRQMARAIGRQPAVERHWEQDYEKPQSATEAYKKLREQGAAAR